MHVASALPPFDPAAFRDRRDQLIDHMNAAGGGVALIPGSREIARNRDTHFPFRQDSYFHYLSGFGEPDAVIALVAGDTPRHILFCREKDEEREIWDGFRYGPSAAVDAFAFDEATTIGNLPVRMLELLHGQGQLWVSLGHDAQWDQQVLAALEACRAQARAGILTPGRLFDVRQPLDAMRVIKDADEIRIMREAARISASAHRRAMRATRPGLHEYAIEAELLHSFRRAGAEAPAYPSIVAGGANACVLHYVDNNRPLNDGELLLIDAGCELHGYAADITRTFPVSGRFSPAQRDIYEIVLAAQQAAREEIAPGARFNAPHDAAVYVLADGLRELGLLEGSLDAILESGSYRRFYMHRTSHWLGRDVHDAGDYKLDGDWRPLEAGMVLTVEPGCYIRPADDLPEEYWNIGIRIEDDALVTAAGCEFITEFADDDAPKSVAAIEELMREVHDDD